MRKLQHDRATDATAREVLEQIWQDESKHAALAWRTIKWAMRQADKEGDGSVKAAVVQAFERAAAADVVVPDPLRMEDDPAYHAAIPAAVVEAAAASFSALVFNCLPAPLTCLTQHETLTVPATAVSLVRVNLASLGLVNGAFSRKRAPWVPV